MPRNAMKTVLIDNSLCSLTIKDDAEAADINRYICALAQTGVRYVEIDFRALMKLGRLPDGIGYIFRPVTPMFLRFTELFHFDYIALTATELERYPKVGLPVMLSLPLPRDYMNRSPHDLVRCAGSIVGAPINSLRIRGDFPLLSVGGASEYIDFLKRHIPTPVDICPTNGCMTALNTAVNFLRCGSDSVTVTMGSSDRYCSLEELMITFLTMYGGCPKGLEMSGLCRAAVLHTRVFNNSIVSEIPELVKVLEDDFSCLMNADTGERSFAGAPFPQMKRRFSHTFADFVKGIKCNWEKDDGDPVSEEAAESYAAALYKYEEKKNPFGRTPPFMN